jgi:hypothetical protein
MSGNVAQADPAPRAPRVIAGSGASTSGVFTASATGAVFELPTRARIRLAPGAAVRLFPVPQNLQLGPGRPLTTWSFKLQSGRADVEIPSVARSAVLVSLGKLNAIVTKGEVACLASSGEASVANLDGEVRTALSDKWRTVALGSIATLSRDNSSVSMKPGLPFPTLTGGAHMFFAPNEAVSMHGFRWTEVPGAHGYELRVRSADGNVVEQRSNSGTELSTGLSPIKPGTYRLSLRSVDARGVQSKWSPDTELRVIGVVLPPGAYANDEAIFLGPGQEVQFTNTTGLEMTNSAAGRSFTADQKASLYHNSTTLVGFRTPGSYDVTTARLEPRKVYADVQIGPKRALWPRDSVSIRIRLKSSGGVTIPSSLQVVPHVSLGLDPLALNFEREGDVLHAVVPPSTGPGPWVLRVDVDDQFGVPLGHDFLEIDAQPNAKPTRSRLAKANQKPAVQPPSSALASSK